MPYISAIEKMGEARGEIKGKVAGNVELISLLLAHQVGKFLRKLPRILKNYDRAVGSTRFRLKGFALK
jgi:hypothetical protein